ncbi:MAG: phosphotransferase [Alphaproteobacteria bacterium]|jgi:aminoglycoside phosphotransferase (APT) family kinase protein|nr:phosphotransferase [Alphaproteobacteria bacterium]MBT5390448.1 phosphotransferase [Alphaproteobacteria bacterium]MBT5654735.1 phosphotransferase [Alphaproteobacteria bacterium]
MPYDRRVPLISISKEQVGHFLFKWEVGAKLKSFAPVSGGFSNTNYKLELIDGRTLLLRIVQRGLTIAQTEISLLKLVSKTVPVPKIYYFDEKSIIEDLPVILMEFVEGSSAQTLKEKNEINWTQMGESIGKTLAAIHTYEFSGHGFIGNNLEIKPPPFGSEPFSYIEFCLKTRAQERLTNVSETELWKFLSQNEKLIEDFKPNNRLVHSDFNLKNLLAENGQITAVLDWEFAYSGNPLSDFGNLFRFPDQYPNDFEEAVTKAYKSHGGSLPPNWKHIASILDLSSMFEYLNTELERPKNFRIANEVIKRVITG